ncbi:MAG: glutathione S-transferase N-terminal domain-containing protein [Pseudomonadota bacterium]
MQIVGMLDSPYVRRLAVSMQLLGVPYEHNPLSVFSTYEQFKTINPVVKVPTLVCDDGAVLMDSSLIIDYVESLAGKSLLPAAGAARRDVLRLVGLALAACEKAVQIVYEHKRPHEMQYAPWLTRVREQMLAAFGALESELAQRPLACDSTSINQAGVTIAVTWCFAQSMLADMLPAADYPALAEHSARAEQLAQFVAAPM